MAGVIRTFLAHKAYADRALDEDKPLSEVINEDIDLAVDEQTPATGSKKVEEIMGKVVNAFEKLKPPVLRSIHWTKANQVLAFRTNVTKLIDRLSGTFHGDEDKAKAALISQLFNDNLPKDEGREGKGHPPTKASKEKAEASGHVSDTQLKEEEQDEFGYRKAAATRPAPFQRGSSFSHGSRSAAKKPEHGTLTKNQEGSRSQTPAPVGASSAVVSELTAAALGRGAPGVSRGHSRAPSVGSVSLWMNGLTPSEPGSEASSQAGSQAGTRRSSIVGSPPPQLSLSAQPSGDKGLFVSLASDDSSPLGSPKSVLSRRVVKQMNRGGGAGGAGRGFIFDESLAGKGRRKGERRDSGFEEDAALPLSPSSTPKAASHGRRALSPSSPEGDGSTAEYLSSAGMGILTNLTDIQFGQNEAYDQAMLEECLVTFSTLDPKEGIIIFNSLPFPQLQPLIGLVDANHQDNLFEEIAARAVLMRPVDFASYICELERKENAADMDKEVQSSYTKLIKKLKALQALRKRKTIPSGILVNALKKGAEGSSAASASVSQATSELPQAVGREASALASLPRPVSPPRPASPDVLMLDTMRMTRADLQRALKLSEASDDPDGPTRPASPSTPPTRPASPPQGADGADLAVTQTALQSLQLSQSGAPDSPPTLRSALPSEVNTVQMARAFLPQALEALRKRHPAGATSQVVVQEPESPAQLQVGALPDPSTPRRSHSAPSSSLAAAVASAKKEDSQEGVAEIQTGLQYLKLSESGDSESQAKMVAATPLMGAQGAGGVGVQVVVGAMPLSEGPDVPTPRLSVDLASSLSLAPLLEAEASQKEPLNEDKASHILNYEAKGSENWKRCIDWLNTEASEIEASDTLGLVKWPIQLLLIGVITTHTAKLQEKMKRSANAIFRDGTRYPITQLEEIVKLEDHRRDFCAALLEELNKPKEQPKRASAFKKGAGLKMGGVKPSSAS